MNIAVLITCHNRKEKTLQCLQSLSDAQKASSIKLKISVYLTDDGSSDGTSEAISSAYPSIKILKGDGKLYWAGGIRNSWLDAINNMKYDGYLLLNDDTFVEVHLFDEIFKTHQFAISSFDKSGIYIGSTRDPLSGKWTYGGAVLTGSFLFSYTNVIPNGLIQECDLGNANVMFVHSDVVDKIGIISSVFTHGVADFDYTLTARKSSIPILVMASYIGYCFNDHVDNYKDFVNMTLKDRVKYLYNPLGLAFSDNISLMKRHFIVRLPFVFLFGWFKIVFPSIYIFANNIFKRVTIND